MDLYKNDTEKVKGIADGLNFEYYVVFATKHGENTNNCMPNATLPSGICLSEFRFQEVEKIPPYIVKSLYC